MGHIVCVGNTAVDIKVSASEPLMKMDSSSGHTKINTGGVARNMAENFARLGNEATLLSAVGQDVMGEYLVRETSQRGVDMSHVAVVPTLSTSTVVTIIGSDGIDEYSVFDGSIIEQISPTYLRSQSQLVGTANMLVVHALISPTALRYAAHLASACHVPLFVNAATGTVAQRILRVIGFSPILGMNRQEAAAITGSAILSPMHAMEVGASLISQGASAVIITLDIDGVVYCDRYIQIYREALEAEAVDSTGVGDALSSTFLAMRMSGFDVDESLTYGLAAAALTLETLQSTCATLTRDTLAHRIAQK